MLSEHLANEDELYHICKNNDSNYDGSFFLGVLSTKIYCLPSCKAKMPLRKNIRMYKKKEEAVSDGLRGCKRCRSEFFPFTQPPWLQLILDHIQENKDRKVEDEELESLAEANISTIRRYFKRYKKSTLGDHQRKIRLNYAMILIKQGISILDIPYMTGFSSLSGFRSAFQKEFRVTPGEVRIDE